MLQRYTDSFVYDTALWANTISDSIKLAKQLQSDLTNYQEMLTWIGGPHPLHLNSTEQTRTNNIAQLVHDI